MTGVRPRRLLTVCLGNHCRSPLAAAVLAQQGGAAVEIRSAGIRDKHAGRPAHPLMIAAAWARGYDLTAHRGQQVDQELLQWADTVLAMDHSNLAALQDVADQRSRVKLRLYLGDQDVPDPWGRDQAAFAAVVTLIEEGAVRHLS